MVNTFYSNYYSSKQLLQEKCFTSRQYMMFLKYYKQDRNNMIRNIGILAHVDAGKTTITEQILYLAGELKTPGSVDKGQSTTDSLNVEIQRGITVRASTVSFMWNNTKINIIDTPGHNDFASEVERSLMALDGIILIVSAAEGIEAQTEKLWKAIRTLSLPCIIAVNKTDRMNSDLNRVLEDIETRLNTSFFVVNKIRNERTDEVSSDSAFNGVDYNKHSEYKENLIDTASEHDDRIMEKYLEGLEITFPEIKESLVKAVKSGVVCPVVMCSAKLGQGMNDLLTTIIDFLPAPEISQSDKVSGVIFNTKYDNKAGKLSYIRLFSGELKPKDIIRNESMQISEKLNLIKIPSAKGLIPTESLKSGDIAVVTGLAESCTGDIIGDKIDIRDVSINTATLKVQVIPENMQQYSELAEALHKLNSEEPNLNFQWLKDEREFNIDIMGYIHIQILEQLIFDRFNIKVKLTDPTVIYKETPSAKGIGYEEYTMPKPCWAVVTFEIEPGKTGSGIHYESKVSVDKIARKYQNEIEATISKALKQGIRGWEVTDLRITLIGEEDHEVHSRPGDFIVATQMGIMNGLKNCGTDFLEPVNRFTIKIREDLCGKVMNDIILMRGTFETPDISDGIAEIKGKLPVASSLQYQIELASLSGGKAQYLTEFYRYEKCPESEGVERPYQGISPLDRAKFILKARKAITE